MGSLNFSCLGGGLLTKISLSLLTNDVVMLASSKTLLERIIVVMTCVVVIIDVGGPTKKNDKK